MHHVIAQVAYVCQRAGLVFAGIGLFLLIVAGGVYVTRAPVVAQGTFSCANVTEISQSECRALVTLYNTTNGPTWSVNSGWLTTNTPCRWYGITCEGNHVTLLILPDNGLSGPLPPEIGALIYLQVLDLAENPPPASAQSAAAKSETAPSAPSSASLINEILFNDAIDYQQQRLEAAAIISATRRLKHPDAPPVQAANAPTLPPARRTLTETSMHLRTQVSRLDAALTIADSAAAHASTANRHPAIVHRPTADGVNQLTGALPASLGNLRALLWLDLSGNRLSGLIPAEIGYLTSLTNLDLQHNALSGPLPVTLANLTTLTHLNVYANALTGTIPPVLGQLTNLELLDLGGNQLTGAIPPELGNLTNLTALGLCGNGLTGTIPPALGNLSQVTIFFLCYNQLSGPIPPELGALTSVQNLRLDVNQLSGAIPAGLSDLQNLQYLRLETNQLNGPIPDSLGGLSNLLVLNLFSNRLSGPIPATLGNLKTLVLLDLNDNRLSGPLPPALGGLPNLAQFSASLNRLSGPLPPALGQLSNLQLLNLGLNDLSGSLPPELGNLRQLQYLALFDNQFTGSIPEPLTTLPLLRSLLLNSNQLSGALPAGLGNLANLEQVGLFNNYLSGSLPPALGNLSKLTLLMLDNNQLSGALPPELGQLTQLVYLRLGANQLTGVIPPELGNLSALADLWLNENRLSGSLPPQLGDLPQLRILWLNDNQLSGEIPAALANLTGLERLWLQNNRLSGAIPAGLGDLSNLDALYLSGNFLSGAIPPELGRLGSLQSLWLYGNRFSGAIPPELANLTNLQVLWLDVNQLSGPIPPELGQLSNLRQLQLAVNGLSGPIPPELAALKELTNLHLRANLLSGAIPPELGNLPKLRTLWLDTNQLSGALPPELGRLTNLTEFLLHANQLSGSIPPQWETMRNLETLWLDGNRLSGALPPQLGNLVNLIDLNLAFNQFGGELPPQLRFLNALVRLDLRYNGFTATDSELLAFLAQKAPDWAATQTVAPTAIGALPHRSDAIALTWTPIAYGDDGGAYEVEIATAASGPFALHGRTVDKRTAGYIADGLTANTTYFFRVRTVTPPHSRQAYALASGYTAVVSATTIAATADGDSYENDDRCPAARALVTDGRSHSHTFHQPGDQDWTQFNTQISVTYRIDVQAPAGSRADVTLRLYTNCADTDPETLDQSFSPGVQFTFVAPQSGVLYLQLTNADSTVSGSDVTYQVAVRAVDSESGSGAVILLAGRLYADDELQPNIEFVTQRLYQTLLANGYSADDIYYLSTDNNRPGVDAPATTANLHYAITTWAKARMTDEQGLTLYLMDHGDQGVLYVDETSSERLTPAQLHDWLSQLESDIPNAPINVLIEACYSGSFIHGSQTSISKPGRVIITSTNLHNQAFASAEGAYFSDHLLTALRQGHHLFSGFWEARIAVRQVTTLLQDPWLDADGDGIPNELEDAAIAARRTLFTPTAQATSTLWPPYIATVQERAGDDGQRYIQADVRDNGAIAKVWAVIYPPDYVPPAGSNELAPETLPRVDLALEGNRYVLRYSGFTQPGNYRVVLHAEDADGLRARPAVITVNPTAAVDGEDLDGSSIVYLPIVNR